MMYRKDFENVAISVYVSVTVIPDSVQSSAVPQNFEFRAQDFSYAKLARIQLESSRLSYYRPWITLTVQ